MQKGTDPVPASTQQEKYEEDKQDEQQRQQEQHTEKAQGKQPELRDPSDLGRQDSASSKAKSKEQESKEKEEALGRLFAWDDPSALFSAQKIAQFKAQVEHGVRGESNHTEALRILRTTPNADGISKCMSILVHFVRPAYRRVNSTHHALSPHMHCHYLCGVICCDDDNTIYIRWYC